jgi:hypothetical protein
MYTCDSSVTTPKSPFISAMNTYTALCVYSTCIRSINGLLFQKKAMYAQLDINQAA